MQNTTEGGATGCTQTVNEPSKKKENACATPCEVKQPAKAKGSIEHYECQVCSTKMVADKDKNDEYAIWEIE